jgi:hypothetical protein
LAKPSTLEYWHMGDTTIRFGNVTSLKSSGSNKCAMGITLQSLGILSVGVAECELERHRCVFHGDLPIPISG